MGKEKYKIKTAQKGYPKGEVSTCVHHKYGKFSYAPGETEGEVKYKVGKNPNGMKRVFLRKRITSLGGGKRKGSMRELDRCLGRTREIKKLVNRREQTWGGGQERREGQGNSK